MSKVSRRELLTKAGLAGSNADEWAYFAHSRAEKVAETLNLDPAVIAQFPKDQPEIMPEG